MQSDSGSLLWIHVIYADASLDHQTDGASIESIAIAGATRPSSQLIVVRVSGLPAGQPPSHGLQLPVPGGAAHGHWAPALGLERAGGSCPVSWSYSSLLHHIITDQKRNGKAGQLMRREPARTPVLSGSDSEGPLSPWLLL